MSETDATRVTLLLRLRDRADSVSWREFHDRYGQLLYRYARARGAKHADAEDIVQEVELAVFQVMQGFEYDARQGRFRSYLHAAVVHAMGRRASQQARRPAVLDPQTFDQVAGRADAEADQRWEHEWQLHRLRWALRQVAGEFTPATLRAFELHVLQAKSVEDTAAELGLSKASVYQARCRVLKSLRARLAELDPDGDV